jgi:excisionase family DNA binding protein
MSAQNVHETGRPDDQLTSPDGNPIDRGVRRRALLTVPEVAFMLGCGRTLVYELIGSRQLPIVKIGRLTRVPVDAVDDFVRGRVTSTSPAVVETRFYRSPTRRTRARALTARGAAQAELFNDMSGR